jgi:hypothetical protein
MSESLGGVHSIEGGNPNEGEVSTAFLLGDRNMKQDRPAGS